MEFCSLDSNDKWESDCGSVCCPENYHIRKKLSFAWYVYSGYDLRRISKRFWLLLEERKFKCGFCLNCWDCRRFRHLCLEYENIVLNSHREDMSYCTALRFCSRNLRYSTNFPTVDFLTRRTVDEDFPKRVKEKEKILYKVINRFRKQKLW